MNKTSVIKSIIWLGVGVLAGYLVWRVIPYSFRDEADPGSQEYLGKIAAEINKAGAVMIDQETEMMPAEAAPGMLIYNYRLVNYSVIQLDPVKFAAGAKKRVAQGACNRPETRDYFLKKGVALRYSYFDKNKQHIATVDVTPADCGF